MNSANRKCCNILLLILCWFFLVQVNREAIAFFEPKQFAYSDGSGQEEVFSYQLFIPHKIIEGKKYPLIIWLHGHGTSGKNNQSQLNHIAGAIFTWEEENGDFPGFVLLPQVPKEFASWPVQEVDSYPGVLRDPYHLVYKLIQKTCDDYPIDGKRATLVGVSSGGKASWELAGRYPNLFAAVVPISSTGSRPETIESISRLPIWAFNCTHDTSSPIESIRKSVAVANQTGGIAHLTEIESASHDAWTAAFERYQLIDWLLKQRQGDPSSPSPGHRPLLWWQLAIVPAMTLIAIISLVAGYRRRQSAAPSKNDLLPKGNSICFQTLNRRQ